MTVRWLDGPFDEYKNAKSKYQDAADKYKNTSPEAIKDEAVEFGKEKAVEFGKEKAVEFGKEKAVEFGGEALYEFGKDAAGKYNTYKSYADAGLNTWSACHDQIEEKGASRETVSHCLETAVGEAAYLYCSAYGGPLLGSVCKEVAGPIGKFVGGVIYDVGTWLGLTNAKEEARKHAQQSAAWDTWQQADAATVVARNRAADSLGLAVLGALATDKNLGLDTNEAEVLKSFKLFGLDLRTDDGHVQPPDYYWDTCFASIKVDDPESSAIDAAKVINYEWKEPCKIAAAKYWVWQSTLRKAVIRYGIEASLEAANRRAAEKMAEEKRKKKKKKKTTVLVLGAGGAAVAAWWFLPKGFFSQLLK